MTYPTTTSETSPHQRNNNDQGSCRPCLYTGVATCIGLSAYFYHLAHEDTVKEISGNNKDGLSKSQQLSNQKQASPRSSELHKTLLNLFRKEPPPRLSNRPFLLTCSAFWAVAGTYRLYLN